MKTTKLAKLVPFVLAFCAGYVTRLNFEPNKVEQIEVQPVFSTNVIESDNGYEMTIIYGSEKRVVKLDNTDYCFETYDLVPYFVYHNSWVSDEGIIAFMERNDYAPLCGAPPQDGE